MPRRKGWDYAQLRSSFASDPEFIRLARTAPDDLHYLAAIGLWALALAQSWKEDDPHVADVIGSFDSGVAELLGACDLVIDDEIAGYGKWTARLREEREADAERKRSSAAIRRSPPESSGGTRTPRGVEVEEEVKRKANKDVDTVEHGPSTALEARLA